MKAKLERIFRAYDIRGVYGRDFDEEFARFFGRAYAVWLAKARRAPKPQVFLGRDVRHSSPSLARAMALGLKESGVKVLDAGTIPTPLMYYLVWRYPKTGGIEVTASHNPPEYNGIKPAWNSSTLTAGEQQQVRKLIEAGAFRPGRGSVTRKRFEGEYLRHTIKGLKCARRLKVVVDAGNGTCGSLGLRLARRLGATAVGLHCKPIPGFPNHQPDPLKPENVRDLQEKVVAEGADLGIAYDGDGDRVAFIDEKGGALSSDEALILFMRDLAAGLPKRARRSVLYTVQMSNAISEEARKLGFSSVMTPVGHTDVQHLLNVRKAPLGGEASGHFFFMENGGYDDAFHAAARFMHFCSRLDSPLSELRRSLPRYFSTPSFYVHCTDERKFKVVDAVKASLDKGYNTIKLDGVRVELLRSWGLLRASNTNPQLNLRFEGESMADLRAAYQVMGKELVRHKLKLPPLESVLVQPQR